MDKCSYTVNWDLLSDLPPAWWIKTIWPCGARWQRFIKPTTDPHLLLPLSADGIPVLSFPEFGVGEVRDLTLSLLRSQLSFVSIGWAKTRMLRLRQPWEYLGSLPQHSPRSIERQSYCFRLTTFHQTNLNSEFWYSFRGRKSAMREDLWMENPETTTSCQN